MLDGRCHIECIDANLWGSQLQELVIQLKGLQTYWIFLLQEEWG